LTGVPTFVYYNEEVFGSNGMGLDAAWTLLNQADAANYIVGAGSPGSGNDKAFTSCGINASHAYSLLAPFNMTDSAGKEWKMLMLRNPWRSGNYSGPWNSKDTNWSNTLVS
jgi:hypothetical protein